MQSDTIYYDVILNKFKRLSSNHKTQWQNQWFSAAQVEQVRNLEQEAGGDCWW